MMSIHQHPRDRIDPETIGPLDRFLQLVGPRGFASIPDIRDRRAKAAELLEMLATDLPALETVSAEDRVIPGAADAPEVAVRVYRPVEAVPSPAAPVPSPAALLFIHGGGMVMGTLDTYDAEARSLTDAVGCNVVAVDYRLAPENPHPALVEDCYAALVWMDANAAELGIDERRIGVYGQSAGGGLAAATALLARDRGGPSLVFQALIYPMLDDRSVQPSTHEIVDLGVWDRGDNIEAWQWVLGSDYGTDDVSPYAAPARATDLSGLPPAYIDVGGVELFRDESIEYATRLMQAGVATELHVNPGAYHAAELFAAGSALSKRVLRPRIDALRRALGTVEATERAA